MSCRPTSGGLGQETFQNAAYAASIRKAGRDPLIGAPERQPLTGRKKQLPGIEGSTSSSSKGARRAYCQVKASGSTKTRERSAGLNTPLHTPRRLGRTPKKGSPSKPPSRPCSIQPGQGSSLMQVPRLSVYVSQSYRGTAVWDRLALAPEPPLGTPQHRELHGPRGGRTAQASVQSPHCCYYSLDLKLALQLGVFVSFHGDICPSSHTIRIFLVFSACRCKLEWGFARRTI